MKEYWDIYTVDKRKTGRTMERNDWHMAEGDYYLSVLGVVKRSDGRFLITRRVMTKAWAPGWWEVPGGGVKSGESGYEAVLREMREETGLDLSGVPAVLAHSYHREAPGQNYIVDIYLFNADVDESELAFDSSETMGGYFATADEIKAYAEEGVFLHFQSMKSVFGF